VLPCDTYKYLLPSPLGTIPAVQKMSEEVVNQARELLENR
jgi:hypothetical protein